STVTSTVAGPTTTVTGPTTTVTGTPPGLPASSSIVTLNVNGLDYTLNLDNRWTLANALRYKLNLIGTKVGCDRGECGACAVLVGGVPMLSCTMLAVESQGKSITTIEGIGGPENLSPVQAALCDSDGIDCGACIPGIVIVSTAFLKANPGPTQPALANALAGNLCKCGNWPHIFAGLMSVKQA
ncbi:MAG: 2Fe-2S iron-sulfur cluster-binding protein, partial [Conexivisphaerales archaeon]